MDKETNKYIICKLREQGLDDSATFIATLLSRTLLNWKVKSDSNCVTPEAMIAFSFGHRIDKIGNREPGPINKQLAKCVESFYRKFRCPVWAQWEVGISINLKIIPRKKIKIIYPTYDKINDVPIYLSTLEIFKTIKGDFKKGNKLLIIAHHDHLWRCVETARNCGYTVMVDQDRMPKKYDKESSQIWTTARNRYLLNDIISRLNILRNRLKD